MKVGNKHKRGDLELSVSIKCFHHWSTLRSGRFALVKLCRSLGGRHSRFGYGDENKLFCPVGNRTLVVQLLVRANKITTKARFSATSTKLEANVIDEGV
jgi:hypothetical protein